MRWLAATLPILAANPYAIAQCHGDLNGDSAVTGADVGILLGAWGTSGGTSGADLDGSGVVSGADLGVLLGAWGPCPAPEPNADGRFPEWNGIAPIATDPADDASGAFDVRMLFAINRGSRIFLRFDTSSILNLQSGPSTDGTLVIMFGMPGGRSLSIDLRNRKLWRDGDPSLRVSWSDVNLVSGPTHAASEFELAADLAMFGVDVGSTVTIGLTGSDSLTEFVPFTMSRAALPPARRSAARATGTSLRIASLNTFATGLLSTSRRPRILRLIDAADADIYCLQEEYSSTAAQLAASLEEADPREDGSAWNVHKVNDCAIASTSTILPIASTSTRMAAAVVDPPVPGTQDAVVVFSIHPNCCGFIGSVEDERRIAEMGQLLATLDDLRSGSLGPALEPYRDAPAIVAGDWNLVGSDVPLRMLADPNGPGMIDVFPLRLIGEDCTTWRSTSTAAGSFCPGRLDLIAHSPSRLSCLRSFLLETSALNETELMTLGLQSTDSTASDHLLMAADFAVLPPEAWTNATPQGPTPPRSVPGIIAGWMSSAPRPRTPRF